MDFEIPSEIQDTLDALDAFIDAEIRPLEQADDNVRFFDHRREYARTDFDHGGVPRQDWEDLLAEMRRRADAAGWLRHALPAEYGGHDASNLEMAIIREHLATKGLGLHNDLQNESSIVGNFPTVLMMRDFGTDEQRAEWMPGFLDGTRRLAFGLTEPNHGLRRDLPRDDRGARRRRVGAQRHEAVQLRAAPRDARHRVRAHLG